MSDNVEQTLFRIIADLGNTLRAIGEQRDVYARLYRRGDDPKRTLFAGPGAASFLNRIREQIPTTGGQLWMDDDEDPAEYLRRHGFDAPFGPIAEEAIPD